MQCTNANTRTNSPCKAPETLKIQAFGKVNVIALKKFFSFAFFLIQLDPVPSFPSSSLFQDHWILLCLKGGKKNYKRKL